MAAAIVGVLARGADLVKNIELAAGHGPQGMDGADVTQQEGAALLGTMIALASNECAALRLLNKNARVALAGSLAPVIADEVRSLLGCEVTVYDEWCASRGLARIARDVFSGKNEILGLAVDL